LSVRRSQFIRLLMLAVIGQCLQLSTAPAHGATPQRSNMLNARGTFEVKITPQSTDPVIGRMTIAKTLHGDLEGTSTGEMLTAMTAVKDSAGYVAEERVTGTLQGRSGTFILQHHATMARGEQHLSIEVVPDSGTGELTGIAGTMSITIDKDGKHFYQFEYTLPAR
jgi:hypothetical protein